MSPERQRSRVKAAAALACCLGLAACGDRYQLTGGSNAQGRLTAVWFMDVDNVKTDAGGGKIASFLMAPAARNVADNSPILYYEYTLRANCQLNSADLLASSMRLASGRTVIGAKLTTTAEPVPNATKFGLIKAMCFQPIPAENLPIYFSRDMAFRAGQRMLSRGRLNQGRRGRFGLRA